MDDDSMPVKKVDTCNVSLTYCDAAQCKSIINNWTAIMGIIFYDVVHDMVHKWVDGFVIKENANMPNMEIYDDSPDHTYNINGSDDLEFTLQNRIECNVYIRWNELHLFLSRPQKDDDQEPKKYRWNPADFEVIITINDISQQFTIKAARGAVVAIITDHFGIRDSLQYCCSNCNDKKINDCILINKNINISNFNVNILSISYEKRPITCKAFWSWFNCVDREHELYALYKCTYNDIESLKKSNQIGQRAASTVPPSQSAKYLKKKKKKKKKTRRKIQKKKHKNYYYYLQKKK
eukprot:428372_1